MKRTYDSGIAEYCFDPIGFQQLVNYRPAWVLMILQAYNKDITVMHDRYPWNQPEKA